MRIFRYLAFCCFAAIAPSNVVAGPSETRWTTSWVASAQGPYPIGNPTAQPNLSLVFPSADIGARDQSFRLIVRPDIWGKHTRLRFSNAFGTKPVTFDDVYVGLQLASSALIHGTNQPVRFAGRKSVTVAPGASVWSDAVALPFVRETKDMAGRKMAVSFQVVGESGPMTWHAKALTTSYVSLPGAGSHGRTEDETAFPASTTSWFFLDAVDMRTRAPTHLVVALGDSITDGTGSTLNGDDRWTDVLSRRLHALYREQVAVVNAGIGGNQVIGPKEYTPQTPSPGGPSALGRLERDVLALSNVGTVIWLEGINDFSKNGNATAEAVIEGMKQGVARIRAGIPGVRVVGATVTPALGSTSAAHGFAEQDEKRKTLNEFILRSGTFDAVVEFDKVIVDPATGGMRADFVPESTTGGGGDKLHPNRQGYQAMGMEIDLNVLVPSLARRGR